MALFRRTDMGTSDQSGRRKLGPSQQFPQSYLQQTKTSVFHRDLDLTDGLPLRHNIIQS